MRKRYDLSLGRVVEDPPPCSSPAELVTVARMQGRVDRAIDALDRARQRCEAIFGARILASRRVVRMRYDYLGRLISEQTEWQDHRPQSER